MALSIGFLHSDKHGRNSLVWDAIEPLRAKINANVFDFVASHEFTRADFPASGINTHRVARPVIAELLKRCVLPDRAILDAATWLRDLVMARGSAATAVGRSFRKAGRGSTTHVPALSAPDLKRPMISVAGKDYSGKVGAS
jgi:CRISPR associated protein Cas1